MASIYNQSIHKSLNTSNTGSFEIIKQTHQTESLSHVWAQFTKGELRNTFTYIPRLLTKKTLGWLGNAIEGKRNYRITTKIGHLITSTGQQISHFLKFPKHPPQLQFVPTKK